MKTTQEIENKINLDINFITSAITNDLSETLMLHYFTEFEGRGGCPWFYDWCSETASELLFEKDSAYLNYLEYWINAPNNTKYEKGFSETSGTNNCFDWYFMYLAREKFESEHEKDKQSEIIEQMAEMIGERLTEFNESERGIIMSKANDLCYKITHKKKIAECVKFLKSKDLDGESTQHILEAIGMDYQMYTQLKVKYNE